MCKLVRCSTSSRKLCNLPVLVSLGAGPEAQEDLAQSEEGEAWVGHHLESPQY